MSKAEELARKYCEGSSFEDACIEKPAYIAGYHQAEKDLKLTWEEMMEKAVDAELYSDGMLTPLIGVNDKEVVKDIKFGDKIKLIIIKDKKDV